MTLIERRDKAVISKFQELLRSGMDYSVEHMYNEAGGVVYIKGCSARIIINKYYQQIISEDMIVYVCSLVNLNITRKELVSLFSKKFKVCKRESILLIRYIKSRNE